MIFRLALLTPLLLTAPAAAAPCPLPGQTQMLVTRLYFGQDIEGRAPLTGAEWRAFLTQIVTPRFPDGFTVYDAHGQWMNAHVIVSENSKVIEIAAPDTPTVRSRLGEIARLYREKFHQQAVGSISDMHCAAF